MSAWNKITNEKQEELKNAIRIQVEDLVEDAADEIEEDTIEELGESLWDSYIGPEVETEIEKLGFVHDYTNQDEFTEIWEVLYEYYWTVYQAEVDKLFE